MSSPRSSSSAAALALAALTACSGPAWRAPPPPPETPAGLTGAELVAALPEDDLWPRATPDGQRVVFVSQQNGNMDIWVRDYAIQSTYPLTLDPLDDFDPAVSPNGRQVAFVSRRSDARGDIYVVDGFETGSDPRRLTGAGSRERQPVFAPDGRRLYLTQAYGLGAEHIAVLDIARGTTRRLSPGPGFDPSVSPDGRYLVYTAPGRPPDGAPHLTALRLTDNATRAVTRVDVPAGFSRFAATASMGGRSRIVFNRFADDDNGDGTLDADDQASLWRIDVDLDALFEGRARPPRPFPLTDGSQDELFADVEGGWLYFTRGTAQQDIARLPASGLFPVYEDPARYFALAKTLEDPRSRWFTLRCAFAAADPGSDLEAQAQLAIGRLHEAQGRADLAQVAFRTVIEVTADAPRGSVRARLGGLAEVARVDAERSLAFDRAVGPGDRAAAARATRLALGAIEADHRDDEAVLARAALARAEVSVALGQRVAAAESLEALVARFAAQSETAARALLRRIDLLGVAYAPEPIGEAYRRVLERFPAERAVVREASGRIVDAQLGLLDTGGRVEEEVDALRRLVERYGAGPVRREARWALVERMNRLGDGEGAAAELARLVEEAGDDRLAAAKATLRLARRLETEGKAEAALARWRRLRSEYGDLPGFGVEAAEAITRVSLTRARTLERDGDFARARDAYRKVLDNDLDQIEAHRRFLALSARTGAQDAALDAARARVEASPRTPVARYALGLAYTWTDPPRLGDAREEIDAAIALNPQLVPAYVTKGWILEMSELEEPGFFTSFVTGFVQTLTRAVVSALDGEAGRSGGLEQAVDAYKTALRLNPESADPEMEAQILLNLGNAHYRLAAETNDQSNMRLALDRYLAALRLGLEHRDPRGELVFWERLGRAAAWVDEPAVGAMATRRALDVAERSGLDGRLAQLWGNLALVYTQAGEAAYAREALEIFEARRADAGARSGLVIAVRDRASARLDTHQARSARQLDEILDELSTGRRVLEDIDEMERGALPTLWLSVNPNGTRAQFGFDRRTEEDLNLALAARAHAALGEPSRAQALLQTRLDLTRTMIDDVPGIVLGAGAAHPTPLGVLRERLGLILSDAEARARAGDAADAAARLRSAASEVDGWLAESDFSADHPALHVDRARVWAARAGLAARAAPLDLEEIGRLEAARAEAEKHLAAALEASTSSAAPSALRTLPPALTSSLAFAFTASVALAQPATSGVEREAYEGRARVWYAQGLLQLARTRAPPDPGPPAALWAGLDARLDAVGAAREAFVEAARAGAEAGPGVGARVVAHALAGIGVLDRAAGSEALADAANAEAIRVATGAGDVALARRLEVASGVTGAPEAVAGAVRVVDDSAPLDFAPARGLVDDLLVRTASLALVKGDLGGAFRALDRALLHRAAIRVAPELTTTPEDRAVSQRILRAQAELVEARRAWAAADARVSRERFTSLREDLHRRRAALSKARRAPLSELGQVRAAAQPRFPEELAFDLGPKEGLLLPAPIDGQLHLFLVDGSTVAESPLAHAVSPTPWVELRADLGAVHEAYRAGAAADPARLERLRAALFAPLQERLTDKRHLLVAAGWLDAPLPTSMLRRDDPALAHLSAPSVLPALREAQLVGVAGRRVVVPEDVAAAREASLAADATVRLGPAAMLPFRAERETPRPEPGEPRRLVDRPAVEALADRAVDLTLVQVDLRLEPEAPERSALSFGASPDAGGYSRELPLERLDLPARLLVLSQVRDDTLGGAASPPGAWLALDQPLAARGFAVTVAVPATAPPAAVADLVGRVTDRAPEVGPAAALREALDALGPATPALYRSILIGTPGLDAAGTRAYAKDRLTAARRRALTRLKEERYYEAAQGLRRWIRLQIEAEEPKYVRTAYQALVAILEKRVSPPDYPRAAEAQAELLEFLRGAGTEEAKLLEARIDLAYLYSLAHDYERAERAFEAVLADARRMKDDQLLGLTWYRYGQHHREALRYADAAEAMEKAIQTWADAGVYEAQKIPADAVRALREVGEIYLNRLSDPVRARVAYERALRYERDAEGQVAVQIDLVRVARRSGDFAVASERAARARAQATKLGEEILALSALIENANVAWYQGDYRQGSILCQESLQAADRLLSAKSGAKVDARQVRRRKIYALSVCGLVSMSQRDEPAALGFLQRAMRISRALNDERETATQLNNLGRVYLEFGRVEAAADAFERARAIDERLEDRYALAYDLRNLGRARLEQGRYDAARAALTQALTYSEQARDTNNELRARFALAELYEATGDQEAALAAYRLAEPLAESLDVKALRWPIQRALGRAALRAGDVAEAERRFLRAVSVARTITGRAGATPEGENRYAAFDDLARLYLDTGRPEAAYATVDEARRLEQLALLDDARIPFESREVPALLDELRQTRTSSVVARLQQRLTALAPRVAALMRAPDVAALRARIPQGAAVLTYRVTAEETLAFWLDSAGLRTARIPSGGEAVAELVGEYADRMEARADVTRVHAALADRLLGPLLDELGRTRRLALVVHGPLAYVAFPALPFGDGALVDQATTVRALHPVAAVDALAAPGAPLAGTAERRIIALGGAVGPGAPLPFAARELTVIQEAFPAAELVRGDAVRRARLLSALRAAPEVLHFAGHARLYGIGNERGDPLAAALETADGPVTLLDVLGQPTAADLVVLSACATRLGQSSAEALDGEDLLSLAEAFHLAGAGRVLATTLRVDDIAAALVMKRFYRAARAEAPAEALRTAQRAVRGLYPHPAWWAGFVLSTGG